LVAHRHGHRRAKPRLGGLYTTAPRSEARQPRWFARLGLYLSLPVLRDGLVFYRAMPKRWHFGPDTCAKCSEPLLKRKWPRTQDVPVQVVGAAQVAPCRTGGGEPIFFLSPMRKPILATRGSSRVIDESREMFSRSAAARRDSQTRISFSPRNAIALLELWRAIQVVRTKASQEAFVAFTAILRARHAAISGARSAR